MKFSKEELTQAYYNALQFTRKHYENFPVISFIIPKNLRKHIAIIYQFARQADDIADEGILSDEERLNLLNEYEESLKNSFYGDSPLPFWGALIRTIKELNLSIENFQNLIKAFKQDVIKKRYKSFPEILDYCKCSANPVGRIILELFNIRNDKTNEYSDSICTALQLTNFYQDVSLDIRKGRIYFPEDEMKLYKVTEKDFEREVITTNLLELVKYQVERTKLIFKNGYNLIHYLPIRLKYEIKWTILGGEKILAKIEENNYNVFINRPVLSKTDYSLLLLKSVKKIKDV